MEIMENLGFALSLDNENERADRDNYLDFKGNCETLHKEVDFIPTGLYDYDSLFHFNCENCIGGWPVHSNVTYCGKYSTRGLSVMDADNINALYGCKGCYRHRWKLAESLTQEDKANMYSFGLETVDGSPVYSCRGRVQGSIYAGIYNISTKSCQVALNKEVYEIKGLVSVEVLTIPGGLSEHCSVYKLVEKNQASANNAVAAGALNKDYKWKSYVAYAVGADVAGLKHNSVGYVWNGPDTGFENFANVVVGQHGWEEADYRVLTCVEDTACMLEKLLREPLDCV